VADAEVHAAMRALATRGLAIGDCGAAPLAAVRALATEDACADLRAAIGIGPSSRVLLVASEGVTDPDAYRSTVG
jgi:diaminopropionate ammonia-lyase